MRLLDVHPQTIRRLQQQGVALPPFDLGAIFQDGGAAGGAAPTNSGAGGGARSLVDAHRNLCSALQYIVQASAESLVAVDTTPACSDGAPSLVTWPFLVMLQVTTSGASVSDGLEPNTAAAARAAVAYVLKRSAACRPTTPASSGLVRQVVNRVACGTMTPAAADAVTCGLHAASDSTHVLPAWCFPASNSQMHAAVAAVCAVACSTASVPPGTMDACFAVLRAHVKARRTHHAWMMYLTSGRCPCGGAVAEPPRRWQPHTRPSAPALPMHVCALCVELQALSVRLWGRTLPALATGSERGAGADPHTDACHATPPPSAAVLDAALRQQSQQPAVAYPLQSPLHAVLHSFSTDADVPEATVVAFVARLAQSGLFDLESYAEFLLRTGQLDAAQRPVHDPRPLHCVYLTGAVAATGAAGASSVLATALDRAARLLSTVAAAPGAPLPACACMSDVLRALNSAAGAAAPAAAAVRSLCALGRRCGSLSASPDDDQCCANPGWQPAAAVLWDAVLLFAESSTVDTSTSWLAHAVAAFCCACAQPGAVASDVLQWATACLRANVSRPSWLVLQAALGAQACLPPKSKLLLGAFVTAATIVMLGPPAAPSALAWVVLLFCTVRSDMSKKFLLMAVGALMVTVLRQSCLPVALDREVLGTKSAWLLAVAAALRITRLIPESVRTQVDRLLHQWRFPVAQYPFQWGAPQIRGDSEPLDLPPAVHALFRQVHPADATLMSLQPVRVALGDTVTLADPFTLLEGGVTESLPVAELLSHSRFA